MPLEVMASKKNMERVMSHMGLQQALRDNSPPHGYIDLSYCETSNSMGKFPVDRKTHRFSFKDHFAFEPDSGEVTSITEVPTVMKERVGKRYVQTIIPMTVVVTSFPNTTFLEYQVTIRSSKQTYMRTYLCEWPKAVYLWR